MNPFNISHIFFPPSLSVSPLDRKKGEFRNLENTIPKVAHTMHFSDSETDSSSSAASPQPASLQRADGRLPGCEYPTSAPHKAANPGSSPGQHFGLSRIPGKCRLCWDADLNQSTIK